MLRRRFPSRAPGASVLVVAGLALTLGLSCAPARESATPTAAAPTGPAPTDAPTALLKANPEKGPVGTSFTVTGDGFAPGTPVDLVWATWEGTYTTKIDQETVEFHERAKVDKRIKLGRATTDAQGRLTAALAVPEDYGDVHDLYAEVNGKPVGKGGFKVEHRIVVTSTEGPVGADITIKATGLSLRPYTSTLGVLWDNRYAGFLSATTTNGTALGKIRAAGPVGKHSIQVYGASQATPFLNPRQGASGWKEFWADYTVTRDDGPPPQTLEWPDPSRVVFDPAAPRTTASGVVPAAGLTAAYDPASGPILSNAILRARGLPPSTSLDLVWVTVVGNRVQGGWSMVEKPLGAATTAEDGSLTAPIQVPDDLGGWHVTKLVQNGQTLAEVPFFVEHSLVSVSPARVRAGEAVTVQIKGIGWTELDNGVSVSYDNSYLGYACGFNSGGDITLLLPATGAPGTHLIDLHPMLYQGHGKPPWSYQMPQLTFAQDAPGLALGYRLPTYRLAITVVE